MKVGTSYERLDINRQYENISSLQGYLPIPKIYDYANNDNQAVIILEKMPGDPLHTLITFARSSNCSSNYQGYSQNNL